MDLNGFAQFKTNVTPKTDIINDWLTFEEIYATIKFYSRKTVEKMRMIMQNKWFGNEFVKFKHVSALMPLLF